MKVLGFAWVSILNVQSWDLHLWMWICFFVNVALVLGRSLESLGNKSRNLLRCGCTLETFQSFSIRIFRETVRNFVGFLRTWACQRRKHLYAMAPLSVSSVQRHKVQKIGIQKTISLIFLFVSLIGSFSFSVLSFNCNCPLSVQVSEWRDHGGRKVPEHHRGMDKNKWESEERGCDKLPRSSARIDSFCIRLFVTDHRRLWLYSYFTLIESD